MARPATRPQRKAAGQYHHGDLRRALVAEALRTIETAGVEGLTLRAIGETLRVSRTALYRHFADKGALLAAVGREGFRMLRESLTAAWEGGGRGRAGFEAMGRAYMQFAVDHPAHYRVMFGRFVESCQRDDAFVSESEAAFTTLVDALVEQQRAGLVRADAPEGMAMFVWSVVHGVAMLRIDGQLRHTPGDFSTLVEYTIDRLQAGLQDGGA